MYSYICVCACVFVYVLVIQYKVCICETKVSHIYNVSLFAILSLSFPLFMFCVFLMVSVTYNFFGVVAVTMLGDAAGSRGISWRIGRDRRTRTSWTHGEGGRE